MIVSKIRVNVLEYINFLYICVYVDLELRFIIFLKLYMDTCSIIVISIIFYLKCGEENTKKTNNVITTKFPKK